MKQTKLLFIALATLLTECNGGILEDNDVEIFTPKIMCPTGGPAVAMSYYAGKSNFETTADPSLLMGYFAKGDYDLIVAPTDVGVKAIKQGCKYKLAATITFGNFYLVSTGLDDNNKLDEGDSIVLFQEGGLPDKIFHYIYGNDFNTTITYVKSVAVAANSYDSKSVTTAEGSKKDVDYVLLAEPKLTALNIDNDKIINLNEEFEAASGVSRIFQASIFAKNGAKVDTSLKNIKENIETITQLDANVVKENMNKVSDPQTFFGMPSEMAYKCINNSNSLGIGFVYAKDAIPALKNYLEILGLGDIDESIFKE